MKFFQTLVVLTCLVRHFHEAPAVLFDLREIVSPATTDIYGHLEILGVVSHRTDSDDRSWDERDPWHKIRGILLTSRVSKLSL